MVATTPLTAGDYSTIFGRMLREAVTAERDRRGWNNLTLATEAGVPYSQLHRWLKMGKTIHSDHVERLMDTLGLRVCKARPASAKPARPASDNG